MNEVDVYTMIKYNDINAIRKLCSEGFDFNCEIDCLGNTPLHKASRRGYVEIVKILLSGKADINALNSTGNTPLHEACRRARVKVVRILLSNGANVNSVNYGGNTPLHYAYWRHESKIKKWLCGRGADDTIVNNLGILPVGYSLIYGIREFVEDITYPPTTKGVYECS